MCFDLWKMIVSIENRSVACLGCAYWPILIFSLFLNNVRMTGLTGMGEALNNIYMFLSQKDDGAY